MARNAVPRRPHVETTTAAMIGPRAIPVWPPTAKTLMAVAFLSPAWLWTSRAPSGWKAAMPMPLRTIIVTANR